MSYASIVPARFVAPPRALSGDGGGMDDLVGMIVIGGAVLLGLGGYAGYKLSPRHRALGALGGMIALPALYVLVVKIKNASDAAKMPCPNGMHSPSGRQGETGCVPDAPPAADARGGVPVHSAPPTGPAPLRR